MDLAVKLHGPLANPELEFSEYLFNRMCRWRASNLPFHNIYHHPGSSDHSQWQYKSVFWRQDLDKFVALPLFSVASQLPANLQFIPTAQKMLTLKFYYLQPLPTGHVHCVLYHNRLCLTNFYPSPYYTGRWFSSLFTLDRIPLYCIF
jgi:hypothetical protein